MNTLPRISNSSFGIRITSSGLMNFQHPSKLLHQSAQKPKLKLNEGSIDSKSRPGDRKIQWLRNYSKTVTSKSRLLYQNPWTCLINLQLMIQSQLQAKTSVGSLHQTVKIDLSPV